MFRTLKPICRDCMDISRTTSSIRAPLAALTTQCSREASSATHGVARLIEAPLQGETITLSSLYGETITITIIIPGPVFGFARIAIKRLFFQWWRLSQRLLFLCLLCSLATGGFQKQKGNGGYIRLSSDASLSSMGDMQTEGTDAQVMVRMILNYVKGDYVCSKMWKWQDRGWWKHHQWTSCDILVLEGLLPESIICAEIYKWTWQPQPQLLWQ